MRLLLVTILTFWAGLALGEDHSVTLSDGRIIVRGVGQVERTPDMATIQAGVTSQGETAAEALEATSAATANVLETLKAAGVEARDVQTRGLSLGPLWSNRKASNVPEIVGYEARNTVMVRVRVLDDLGPILDAVVESGANQFQGLSFGLKNSDPSQDEARVLAVKDALHRAELYAAAAGVSVGQIIEISEVGAASGPRPMQMERMAAMADSVPIAAGELSLTAQVTVVFAIDSDG